RIIGSFDEFDVLNGTVFNNNSQKWKRNRQFVTKALMSKKYHLGFISNVQKLFKDFENQWDSGVILDFSTWMSCYKTQITVETVIGKRSYDAESIYTISKGATEYIAMFAFLFFTPRYICNIIMTLWFKSMKQNSIFFNGTIGNIIQELRDEIAKGSSISFNLLDLLLISNTHNDSEYIE
ncbi:20561_t:CDS:1, partial [Racocetra persica]